MTTELRRPLSGARVHFVGIGGAGMAALAELLLQLGYEVSGTDLKDSRQVRRLVELGAAVTVGPHREGGAAGADHVIVSAAVPLSNPEVAGAARAGTDILMRAELLGRIFEAGRGVAVAGTHGKTTTSSMLARALDAAGFAPSFVIGGDLNDVGSGAHLGRSDLVVAEADEAYGSFAHLRAALAVVTNVDADHLDFYAGQDAIDEAFIAFLDRRTSGGAAVLCVDDHGVRRLRERVAAPVHTYGTADADLVVTRNHDGWTVRWHGDQIGTISLGIPGRHNVLNAAGALTACLVLGADPDPALEALAGFTGVERRFSMRGQRGGVTVVDDYAHHPREVEATLAAARERYPEARIVALFQPHLYSRTVQFAEAFGVAFSGADVVVVTDVYGAREEPVPGVSGRLVSDAVRRAGGPRTTVYVPRLEEAAGFVAGLAREGDVVITLGAGDVTGAAPHILDYLGDDR